MLLSTQKQLYGTQPLLSVHIIQKRKEEKGMQQREFALYKRRIEQIEKEKDWQFTGEQTAELIRMAIYPDLRSEEERMQYEDFLMNGLDRVMSENEK